MQCSAMVPQFIKKKKQKIMILRMFQMTKMEI